MNGKEVFERLMNSEITEAISETEAVSLHNFLRGMISVHDYVRKERDDAQAKLAAMESQKPYITLHAEKGDYRIEWHNQWTLSEGSQSFYIRPVPADKPAVAVPDYDLLNSNLDQPWSMRACVKKLVEAAGILLDDRCYDGHGHELISEARAKASEYLSAPSHSQQSAECDQHISMSDEPVWTMFGLTRASWLVWPRVVMQAMNLDWQRRFCALASELNERFPDWSPEGDLEVGLRVNGKMQKLPDDLCNYRHPVDEYRRPLIDRCPSHESEQQRWQEAFDTLPDDYETGDY